MIRKKEMPAVKYFNLEKVSISGFCSFCKNNIPLVIAVSLTLFFTYGIKLFSYSIGLDTEIFMAQRDKYLVDIMLGLGRFGLFLSKVFFHIKEFNPFTAFFTTFCLTWFFTISWCYIIAVFNGGTAVNNALIPFALLFMTTPVWTEQYYFVLQAAEHAFIISLCPYVIYLLYKGFLDSEKGKIFCAVLLIVIMTSIYQTIIPFFCCGVFVCFVLFQEHSGLEPRIYRNLCLKIVAALAGALAVYFFIDKIIVNRVFGIAHNDYLENMVNWGQKPVKENIITILRFGYSLTIGHIPLLRYLINPIIAEHAGTGMLAAEELARESWELGNVLLLPGTVLFLVKISVMRKTIPSGRRLLYVLAGIGIPLSIMIMPVLSANKMPVRAFYVLPLATSFMIFYLIRSYKKKAAVTIACLALLVAAYQAQLSAQLFYSDQMRYNEDVRLAYKLDKLISQVQPDNKLPVALIGRRDEMPLVFNKNFLRGEWIGASLFGFSGSPRQTNDKGLSFMYSLGLIYDMPDDNQLDQAMKEQALMPAYPDPGCVKRMRDFIVVKLSERMYED